MAHLQYMPGDPRLVDQLVYELKSKGIFDQVSLIYNKNELCFRRELLQQTEKILNGSQLKF